MTRASMMAVVCLAASLAGCDGQRPKLPPPPPHGGTAFSLPEGKGFVEALRQDAPDQAGRTQLVVYFIDLERKPLRSAPAAASFQSRGRKAATLALKPIQDADPSEGGRTRKHPVRRPRGHRRHALSDDRSHAGLGRHQRTVRRDPDSAPSRGPTGRRRPELAQGSSP